MTESYSGAAWGPAEDIPTLRAPVASISRRGARPLARARPRLFAGEADACILCPPPRAVAFSSHPWLIHRAPLAALRLPVAPAPSPKPEDYKPLKGEGPLTRRLKDPAEMGQPLDHGDVDEIRQNNIRKSSGSFNRRQDNEDDVDFLAGVESDVLKSLIKKLRDQ